MARRLSHAAAKMLFARNASIVLSRHPLMLVWITHSSVVA